MINSLMSTMSALERSACKYVLLLLLMAVAQDAEGWSCRQPESWQQCSGPSTLCCPSISYRSSFPGTTFSSCCPIESKFPNGRAKYCSNSYAARIYCTKSSKHCCPSVTSTYGAYYSGCCYFKTRDKVWWSTSECLKDVSSPDFCYGESTHCCPYLSYLPSGTSFSNTSTVFSTCCNFKNLNHPTLYFCMNDYGKLFCRDSAHSCCASATYTLGKWHRGCCTIRDGNNSGRENGPVIVGTIVGAVIGTLVILLILGIIIGVVCARRSAANRRNAAAMTVRQGGYPQQKLGAAGPYGGSSYRRPEELFYTGPGSNPSYRANRPS